MSATKYILPLSNRLVILFAVLLTLYACSKENPDNDIYEIITPDAPLDKGDRLFGINISESKFGFEASFEKAKEVGIDVVELNIPWNVMESTEGNYSDPWDGVLSATSFYGNEQIRVMFTIALINTVSWEIPDYLDGIAPNSGKFITSFQHLIDWFIETVPENVVIAAISIGNEVDLVLESPTEWSTYTGFYEAATNYMKQNYPDIKVGVKTTVMGGVFGSEQNEIIAINEFSDVIMLNYYPQNEQFQVKNPETVHEDFDGIVSVFPETDIWITEIGYQSGKNYCKSSETKQAHFFHEMFTAWDTNKDHISFLLIDWLHDQSPEIIDEWKDYYGNDPAMVEFLSTLGLRHYDGTDKPAFKQVKEELKVRNRIK